MKIQWYPGHMAKAKRKMKEDLPLCDVIVEVIDSRCPNSSRNPEIDQLAKDKIRVLLFNKLDLADDERSKLFMEDFHRRGFYTLGIDARNRASVKRVNKLIQEASKPLYEKNRKKGISSQTVRAMVLGIPNVGKSTFINAFVGRSTAKTGNKPGVTRGNQWIKLDKNVQLLDTPGITWPKFDREIVGYNLALIGSINDDILPIEDLVFYFLKYLVRYYPKAILERYGIEPEEGEAALSIMDKIAVKRACIKKGGDVDYTRVSRLILDDFRSGRLGKISLEHPGKWSDAGEEEPILD